MKRKYLSLLVSMLLVINSYAQPELSKEQWTEDLNYLHKLINNKYSHLYQKISKEDFERNLVELKNQIPDLSANEIIVGIAKLIASFKYGHTGMPLFMTMHGEELKTGFHTLPLHFYQFSDGVYIEGATSEHSKALGAKVLSIGDLSIDEALDAIRPVVSVENESFFRGYGLNYLSCPEVLHALGVIPNLNSVELELEKAGQVFTMSFPANEVNLIPSFYGFTIPMNDWMGSRDLSGSASLWQKNLRKPYMFEYLQSENTVYARINEIGNAPGESLAQFSNRLFDFIATNNVEKLVLDLRQNAGGNNYFNKSVILGAIKSHINQKGKFITLIGRRTFSAAQNLVNELEQYTNVTFIGEPTAENVNSWGDVRVEILPNSQLPIRLSYVWWQDKDPRDLRQATAPEIEVEMSFAQFANNEDPVLDVALSYENRLPELKEGLKAHYNAKDFEGAKSLIKDFLSKPDEAYGIAQLEQMINQLGYEYLNSNKEIAIEIFQLNTQLYPGSANAWDSLGEGYLANSQFQKSIESYEKAAKMDPDGGLGQRAKEAAERIKSHMGG